MCGFPHKKSPPVTAGRRFFYPCRRSEKDLQPFRPVIHYAQNCILRSLRRFGRQGKCGCKAPRVGHCEAAGKRISQNTRRLQAFLPEPETEIPVCHANSLYHHYHPMDTLYRLIQSKHLKYGLHNVLPAIQNSAHCSHSHLMYHSPVLHPLIYHPYPVQ